MAELQDPGLNEQFLNRIKERIEGARLRLSSETEQELQVFVRRCVRRLDDDYISPSQINSIEKGFVEFADMMIDDSNRRNSRVIRNSSFRIAVSRFCPRFPIC